jgi:hypothetical protein
MVDRQPAVVTRCMGAADVIRTVKLARNEKFLVAVRGRGHNIASNAVRNYRGAASAGTGGQLALAQSPSYRPCSGLPADRINNRSQ